MVLEPDMQLLEHRNSDEKKVAPVSGSSATVLEPIEDKSEDEDVDFNPFLKESPSKEASSSLSSEVEGLDADVVNSHGGDEQTGDHLKCVIDNTEEERGGQHKRAPLSISEEGNNMVQEKETDTPEAQVIVTDSRNKPTIDLDDEDAICKRTRARYSLASFTLDELETFLQETDDDDDIQNVDEEEEYRKFLAAVLKGGNGDDQENLGSNDDDDDDEDNDADFEIEIEEALESDIDDCIVTSNKDEKFDRSSRRPETRQNRLQKANIQSKKKVTQQGNRPLRPLLPVMTSALVSSVPFPSGAQDFLLNGFMAHQIGQLHCLIYEHVQLLVQVYSLCVLEPSRQHIASQVKGLLSELLHKRDLVLAWRNVPYPTSCFLPQFVNPSVSVENHKRLRVDDSGVSSDGNDGQGCRWLLAVGGPVLSVLDVAPLKLVGRYIDDVSTAVREHQRCCVETTNIYLEKQPLFPLSVCSSPEVNCNVSTGGDPTLDTSVVSPIHKVPKKTLAATLVESAKKQSVALVPRQISKLAQTFYSLFNPALFPHKPPSPAVANRVLFTDAEDVLLAMGMMEYNNDWKAIQQRYLPCKSEHQIFVRAKNRCSSKAPENPIKTVRKMKTSPLTEEEKARIQEGLKAFKLDWASVWRTVVPYRDPNLLPRQWRVAIGTQKSYKADSAKREKHRIYEAERRRRSKATAMEIAQTGSEKEDYPTEYSGGQNESGEDCMDNDNEAYVHEAFLADWRPTASGPISSRGSASMLKSRCLTGDPSAARCCEVREEPDNHGNQESQSDNCCAREISISGDSHLVYQYCMASSYPPLSSKPFACESILHPQRSGKPSVPNLVKLAPELPPVKLPPAVRIISQASLRSSQLGSSTDAGVTASGLENPVCDSTVVDCSSLVNPAQDTTKISNLNSPSVSYRKGLLQKNRCFTKERGTDLDPQMHPLLFRTLEDGHSPLFPVNNSLRIPAFSFFPSQQHQMNMTLLRNHQPAGPGAGLKSFSSKEAVPTSSSLDFHPLLQRTSDFNANSTGAGLTDPLLMTDLELSRDNYVQEVVYHAGATAQMPSATRPVSPLTDANGLDLDIHLSSSSRKRKVSSHDGAETKQTVPSESATKSFEGGQERTDLHGQFSQLADPVARLHSENSSYDNSAAPLHNLDGSGACVSDNVGDQTLLEIVMEQEELSDSDEELEDVEFECEEMADSDGEGRSDAEQIVNTHNKEQSDTAVGTDGRAQHPNSVPREAPEGTQSQRKGRTPRSDLGGRGKSNTKGSWLSLNSHGSRYKPLPRAKDTESSGQRVPAHSNRYCKKAMLSPKNTSSNEQTAGISRLDPSPTPSKKSRKQASKNAPPVRTDVAGGNPNCKEKDGKV